MKSIEINDKKERRLIEDSAPRVIPKPLWEWGCPSCGVLIQDDFFTAHCKYRQCSVCNEKVKLLIPNRNQI